MPSELGFEPRSPRYGTFLVLGLFDTNNAQSGPFLANFGLFLEHIVELEGKKERAYCHGAIMVHVECSNHFPSFGRFEWVLGPFRAKSG